MKTIARFIVYISTLLAGHTALYAQFGETIFYDTLTKVSSDGYIRSAIGIDKYIYLSGSSFSEVAPLPTVTKVDTAGNVIWTAIDHDNYQRFAGYSGFENGMATCKNTFKSGNHIYTVAQPRNPYPPDAIPQEVWCIADSSGSLLWKTPVDKVIYKIIDFNNDELLVIGGRFTYIYYVINKHTGSIVFTKSFAAGGNNEPDIFVDNQLNILLSWEDSCRKFRDNRLNQVVWTSNIPYDGSRKMIDRVIQDSARYIFSGRNNARSVDTLTGNTVWFKPVNVGFVLGVQSGGDGDPRDIILKDSILYITWTSPFVGGVDLQRGFTLTAFNKNNGTIRYNVAYDFNGIPADPVPNLNDDLDWPVQMRMDDNKNIYITGSYDRDPGMESPGNWGIMKINSVSGAKMYEATITDNASVRSERSQGRFIYYFNGRMYSAGNLHKQGSVLYTRPAVVAFDTTSVYTERFRISPDYTVRYSSALTGLTPAGTSQMALLKKVGRSSVIEMRSTTNELLWSRTFSRTGKHMVPQNIGAIADTAITACFFLYLQDTVNKILMTKPDSLVFVRIDTLGAITLQQQVKYLATDTLTALQVHTDKFGKTNFLFRNKNGTGYLYKGYSLGSIATSVSQIGSTETYDADTAVVRADLLSHFNGDTMVLYQTSTFLSGRGWLHSPVQDLTGYPYKGLRLIRHFAKVYSVLKLDSLSFLVMGRDSSNQVRASRYNHRLADPLVWSHVQPVNGVMFNADSSYTSLYAVSRNQNGKKLLLSKLNKLTGSLNWNFERTPAPNTSLLPADFKFDKINHYFITGGYVVDSSVSGGVTRYFYFTLDSSGNIIRDVVRQGYGRAETKINVVQVLQNGTHVYGGTLGTREFGTAGFYNSDCFGTVLTAAVSIAGNTTVQAGQSSLLTAVPVNGGIAPAYQWQDSTSTHTWQNIPGAVSSTHNYTPSVTGDKIRCVLTSTAACTSVVPVTSNTLVFTVNIITAVDPVPGSSYGIIFYPNPVKNILTIDSLKISDKWEMLEIVAMDGKQKLVSANMASRTRVSVSVEHLPAGVYIAVLHRKRKSSVFFKLLKE